MSILQIPIFKTLDGAHNILLAGAGGGFDIYTGLPLYFALRAAGKQVHLANLSFATIYASTGRRIGPAVVEVTGTTEGPEQYFPEMYLAQWLASQNIFEPIYCIDRTGAKPTADAYQFLAERLQPDAVILIDGGTDSLMRGDEPMLGTPQEDIASIAAVDALDIPTKLLLCLGFGVDTFHGVCHHYFLEAVADITRAGGFLGAWSLTPDMPEIALYQKAFDYVAHKMRSHPSIVSGSILSAIEGRFGDFHSTVRTEGSHLYINPLMTLYWAFELDAVARRNLYLDQVRETQTYRDLSLAIEIYRQGLPDHLPWIDLPM
ncbi:hypothetical protein CCAX7_21470 [Capsulimonas corticalis]|uniref:Uncharacterized protein n=1 Tax=Capsulimonas corticalis TaxID=2219043 RepID=A0A402D1X4_9BACT|nr:DUF1152 domain-containing protein [Capsulimonas corticalis]BDI30096.1 hypothetical protein CCAX7_21470 [Capsulimonas corticalis]